MARENTYLEFNNPIHIVWRSGSVDDPYVDRVDISKVVNQRVVLLEIPDDLYRVRISGMQEINYERFIEDTLGENEFYVDYSNGFVYFHTNREAETISISYKGRGMLLYPDTRIISWDGESPGKTIRELIEEVKTEIKDLIDKTENYEEYIQKVIIAINHANNATDSANQSAKRAEDAVKLVENAYETTVLIYQPYVETEDDIESEYPNPEVGWTVQVYDTGVRYRWNGQEWVPIDAFGGNLPLASEEIDGMMSKEDYVKLRDISENVDERVIVFIIPDTVEVGAQDPHIQFPFDGELSEVNASMADVGSIDTEISIEKSKDYQNWDAVTDTAVIIESGEHFDSQSFTISKNVVESGDIYRIVVNEAEEAKNLTVNIKVRILDEIDDD